MRIHFFIHIFVTEVQIEVMKKINSVTCKTPINLGDVILENIDGDANLVATKTIK